MVWGDGEAVRAVLGLVADVCHGVAVALPDCADATPPPGGQRRYKYCTHDGVGCMASRVVRLMCADGVTLDAGGVVT